jgi:hypothetical protein
VILLAQHPRTDVRGTIAKNNTPASFVPSQKVHAVTICEDQIRQIHDEDVISRLGVDELTQFVDIVGTESTANREHNSSVLCAMNFQHRPGPVGWNAMATPIGTFLKARKMADVLGRTFGNGEKRNNANIKNALALGCESGFY